MEVKYLSIANREFIDTIKYYNEQSEGLGFEFAAEVKETQSRIEDFPEAWPIIKNKIRKCRCKRFPYALLYEIRDKTIFIIAVMHLRRQPDYWIDRL